MNEGSFRIEDEDDVRAYLQNLKYCIRSGSTINLIRERRVDQNRDIKHTNRFTIHDLFPNEDPVTALKRELQTLSVRDYIHTLKDTRYPKKSEWRVFGKTYGQADEVYIKIRVELIAEYGNSLIVVMSFHYAEHSFDEATFPYR